MSTMCHFCSMESNKTGGECCCQMCGGLLCAKCEKREISLVLDGDNSVSFCKCYLQDYENESLGEDGSSSYATPLPSPAMSLTSYESCISSLGELLDDLDFHIREDEEEGTLQTGQEDHCWEFSGHLEDQIDGNSIKGVDIQNYNVNEEFDSFSSPLPTEENNRFNPITVENLEDNKGEKLNLSSNASRVGSSLDKPITFEEQIKLSTPLNIDKDSQIWIPPEPENQEEDVESSVADNDGGIGECNDGTKWGQSCSLSSPNYEHGGSYTFKERHQKVMVEVMNGHFRALVRKLLTLERVPFSAKASESWLDIVTYVSWEAATLIKPDVTAKGRAMDPGSYVKVKCIASGSRRQSQVIRGLVFNKNASHKHMQTKFKNPRLLLFQGCLRDHEDGLSSFSSIEREHKRLNSTIELVEMCCPNVVLVEKTVSRDVQESLQAKGITLVFDMKLPRLERVARCTGSQIVSSEEGLMNAKLKQCDTFHTEKVFEEHNNEGAKQATKTLMFFEGCPIPLGCTILLKGAHCNELKKVKFVVQHAVSLAYHLILETSFLVDQKAIFSNTQTVGIGKEILSCDIACNSNISSLKGFSSGLASSHASDIPNFGRFQDKTRQERISCRSDSDSEGNRLLIGTPTILPGQLFSLSSDSIKSVIEDRSRLVPCTSYPSISTYVDFKENDQGSQSTVALPIFPSAEKLDIEMEAKGNIKQEVQQKSSHHGLYNGGKADSIQAFCDEFQMPFIDEGETLFDPQCILILLTSRCSLKGVPCKQNQLSRIKFYGNSDMSLGEFLHDILLNQKHQCSTCGKPPDVHDYSYTHKKGKLSVHVKRLPPELLLSGEAKGMLWMWTVCLKCQWENGIPKPTRRVMMSTLARRLSFGKFLDLGISNSADSSRLASCGHLLHRDCLHFYGYGCCYLQGMSRLGSMVAMVGYSTVNIYTTCMPSPVLEFNNPNGEEWLQNEVKDVLGRGNLFFMEVMNSLQKIVSTFSSSLVKQPIKELNEIEKMLNQEKSDFEASLQKITNKNKNQGKTVHQILNLNHLNLELLLEVYVWDRRLEFLHLLTLVNNASCGAMHEEKLYMQRDGICGTVYERSMSENGNRIAVDQCRLVTVEDEASLSPGDRHHIRNSSNGETDMSIMIAETSTSNAQVSQSFLEDTVLKSGHLGSGSCNSTDAGSVRSSSDQQATTAGYRGFNYSDQGHQDQDPSTRPSDLNSMDCQKEYTPTFDHITLEISRRNEIVTDSVLNIETINRPASGEMLMLSPLKELHLGIPLTQRSLPSNLKDYESWVWTPFSETCKAYRKDLQKGYSKRFDFINSYNPSYLSSIGELITPERSRLHFPIYGGEKIASVYEDEFSSIIACALASVQDQYCFVENKPEKVKGTVERDFDKLNDKPNRLSSDADMASSHESVTGCLGVDGVHSGYYVDPDQLPALSLEGFFSVDSLLLSKALHPEISLGIGNLPGKSKYSVICMYAKQFCALRKRCCPSELDYISSLSRSKRWNAQGGKSGVSFAKTLDDRFVVKQVKKTELNSFLKFAPEYFKHISHSLSSGSQTCLAKILGIYQVIIRKSKSGKEVRTNLMVMENLFFGRNITKSYDLKGVSHSRYASDAHGTLLDQNFIEEVFISPLFVGGKTKQRLQRAVWNDTSFLTSINVMDYSLLLGVDKERHEIVFGIIDYLRQYTWDKHLETWVKASLVVPKNEMPTVISPKEYKKRFRKFISTYFFTIPDHE